MGRKPGDETFKHSILTHFTMDRNCKVCNRTKITIAPCRKRTGTAIPRAENFGDLMTANHKVLSDGSESRNNRRLLCRGARFANSMDPIISAQNKNFT